MGGRGGEGRGCRTEGLARDEIVERAAGSGTRNVDFVLSLSSLTASPRRRYSSGVQGVGGGGGGGRWEVRRRGGMIGESRGGGEEGSGGVWGGVEVRG